MKKKINVAVIGVGHLGKNHARIFKLLKGLNLVGIVDVDQVRAKQIASEYQTRYYFNHKSLLRDLGSELDAVSIVTPTMAHYRIAKDFIGRGIHTFIEKPITDRVPDAKKLVALARRQKTVLQVGHIERFNPALVAVQPYIRNPRFIECHRLAPFSFRSIDIDVILDLMIHDIDIILSLVKSPLKKIDATGVNIFSTKKDLAHVRLLFKNNCVANITASRVSAKSMRKLRVFSPEAYISVDYLDKTVQVYRKAPDLPAPEKLLSTFDPARIKDFKKMMLRKFLRIEKPKIYAGDQLQQELTSFVTCLRRRQKPVVSGEDGLKALEVAQQIIKQIIR